MSGRDEVFIRRMCEVGVGLQVRRGWFGFSGARRSGRRFAGRISVSGGEEGELPERGQLSMRETVFVQPRKSAYRLPLRCDRWSRAGEGKEKDEPVEEKNLNSPREWV